MSPDSLLLLPVFSSFQFSIVLPAPQPPQPPRQLQERHLHPLCTSVPFRAQAGLAASPAGPARLTNRQARISIKRKCSESDATANVQAEGALCLRFYTTGANSELPFIYKHIWPVVVVDVIWSVERPCKYDMTTSEPDSRPLDHQV